MSEKRFAIIGKEYLGYTEGYAYIIRDNSIVCEPNRWRQWSVWEAKEDVEDLCDLLNEQSSKINELEKENEDLRFALRTEQAFTRVEKDKKPFLSKEEFLKELEDECETIYP